MTTIVGTSARRIDAYGKVTGQTEYSGDLSMPGMLHAKILFAGRPHARILSIDTSAAEALPGLVAIFTARDVPVNEYGLQINDQPVLCGPAVLFACGRNENEQSGCIHRPLRGRPGGAHRG